LWSEKLIKITEAVQSDAFKSKMLRNVGKELAGMSDKNRWLMQDPGV
jgi:hypothetical protein